MVGAGDDDHGRLRRHGAQDLPRHVCGRPLRDGRRAGGRPPCARHRLQLCHVLLPHPGQCMRRKLGIRIYCKAGGVVYGSNPERKVLQ